jgi:hypothetical protein
MVLGLAGVGGYAAGEGQIVGGVGDSIKMLLGREERIFEEQITKSLATLNMTWRRPYNIFFSTGDMGRCRSQFPGLHCGYGRVARAPDFSSISRVGNTPQRATAASDYQYLGFLHSYYTV